MINSIDRLPQDYKDGGWFCINKHVNVKIFEEDELRFEIEYDDSMITKSEAHELAQELLDNSINFAKKVMENAHS